MTGCRLLFVPGWNGSCQHHWQSVWQADMGGARVEQSDWNEPHPETWSDTLDAAVAASGPDTVLVAHSLGVLTVARWAQQSRRPVKGAFLVTPPDPESSGFEAIARFSLAASGPLGFPSLLVGSENDHYATLGAVEAMARRWQCSFWNAGGAGHINVASGHGSWLEGRTRFDDFLRELRESGSVAA